MPQWRNCLKLCTIIPSLLPERLAFVLPFRLDINTSAFRLTSSMTLFIWSTQNVSGSLILMNSCEHSEQLWELVVWRIVEKWWSMMWGTLCIIQTSNSSIVPSRLVSFPHELSLRQLVRMSSCQNSNARMFSSVVQERKTDVLFPPKLHLLSI